MEVMLEIYRTLKALGMEWKEKGDLGGLGGVPRGRVSDRAKIERVREYDGGYVDLRAASSIYFIESRARVQDVVVCTIHPKMPNIPDHSVGTHELATLHGGLHQLPRRLSPQEDIQGVS